MKVVGSWLWRFKWLANVALFLLVPAAVFACFRAVTGDLAVLLLFFAVPILIFLAIGFAALDAFKTKRRAVGILLASLYGLASAAMTFLIFWQLVFAIDLGIGLQYAVNFKTVFSTIFLVLWVAAAWITCMVLLARGARRIQKRACKFARPV
jgi:hypothetical protein